MDFKRRHSLQMFKVFKRLRERMDAVHARQSQESGAISEPAV
jgi:hypothetical protein